MAPVVRRGGTEKVSTTSRRRDRHDHAQRPGHAQRALAGAAGRVDRGFRSAREKIRRALRVLASSHEHTFSSGANLGGFAAEQALVHKHFAGERFVGLFKLIGELGKPTICVARGHVLAGRSGSRWPGPDRRIRGGQLRHARDQHRRLPVHDHGAHLPQRAAQAGQRDAAAGRAPGRAAGARGGDRQPRRARRRARRAGSRLGGQARGQVARDHAPGQGGDAPPARHAARRRPGLPARAAHARAVHRGHPRGRQRLLREARPASGKDADEHRAEHLAAAAPRRGPAGAPRADHARRRRAEDRAPARARRSSPRASASRC